MTALVWNATDLVEDVLVRYHDWREYADAVTEAYREWHPGPSGGDSERLGAYVAALDQEESAARAYARALETLETWRAAEGSR